MKIAKKYSHFSGEEYLIIHHKEIYNEVVNTISSIECNARDAEKIFTKSFASREWLRRGSKEILSDYIKNKIALAFYFTTDSLTTFDSFASHLLRYYISEINLAIEVFPTKKCNHRYLQKFLASKTKLIVSQNEEEKIFLCHY